MAGSREDKRRVVVKSVEVTTSCHSTEDCEKVRTALLNLLPKTLQSSVKIDSETLHGFYGNRILLMKAEAVDGELLLKHLAENLSDTEKSILSASFKLRYDVRTGRLYLRFSKQDAYAGSLRLLDSDDVVKVVVHFSNARREEEVKALLRQIGLIR
ncbi:exosome protein [Thermosphaera chiliense]|uniref:Exosome protein n=1 Tax=Thermosphaera chiliense TaxID=3402707 RepID=A0A7M1UQI5_9CREN|nr:RNA-binding domain-containing protein [Thermosphaera aggregans]QOR94510.1 exosome protein [Thermosphaera aggregans]